MAFFSLNPGEKETLKNSKAGSHKTILELLQEPNRLLATILIANNLVNVAIIILSTVLVDSVLVGLGVIDETWKFVIQVVVVTFVLLLLGEVAPKSYATKYALTLATFMSRPLLILGKLFWPLSKPLLSTTRFIDRSVKKKADTVSVDHLSHALDITEDESTTDEEKKILEGIVKFGSTDVKQIMKPRTDVVSYSEETPYDELMDGIRDANFSRIPIFRGSFDEVVGVLYLKDLLSHLDASPTFKWQKLIRAPFFVPENKKIDDLLKEFQEKKIHLAIVVDEYGGTSGIVTLEDIIEEIVGDITDEFDDDDLVYSKLDDNTFVFEGKTPLIDVYRVLDIDGEEFEEAKGESDTLAGFIIEQSGKILRKNEKQKFGNIDFVIEAADKRRIKRIKVTVNPEPEDEQEKSSDAGKVVNVIVALMCMAGLMSCSDDYQPKPKGYFRIDLPEKDYVETKTNCSFSTEIPGYAKLVPSPDKREGECWLNLFYPRNNATVHLTYKQINDNLAALAEESRRMVFDHQVKANAIDQKLMLDTTDNVYGIMYRIGGDVASSLQFYVTDSTNHFLRGSLYFNHLPNSDSIAPVLKFISADVEHLIEQLKWTEEV